MVSLFHRATIITVRHITVWWDNKQTKQSQTALRTEPYLRAVRKTYSHILLRNIANVSMCGCCNSHELYEILKRSVMAIYWVSFGGVFSVRARK